MWRCWCLPDRSAAGPWDWPPEPSRRQASLRSPSRSCLPIPVRSDRRAWSASITRSVGPWATRATPRASARSCGLRSTRWRFSTSLEARCSFPSSGRSRLPRRGANSRSRRPLPGCSSRSPGCWSSSYEGKRASRSRERRYGQSHESWTLEDFTDGERGGGSTSVDSARAMISARSRFFFSNMLDARYDVVV